MGDVAQSTQLRRLLRASMWSGLSIVFSMGSTLLGTVAAARLLSRDAFGAYAAALTTIQLGAAMLLFGRSYLAVKYVAELRANEPDRAGRILGVCLRSALGTASIGAAALFFGAPLLAAHVFKRPELGPLLRLAAPALLFATGNLAISGGLMGLAAFRQVGRLGAWSGLAYLVLIIGGLRLGGASGAVLGIVAAAGLQLVFGSAMLWRETRSQGLRLAGGLVSADRAIWWRFGLPAALSSLTAAPALWLLQAAIVRQSDGLVQLGGYLAAYNLMTGVLLLPNIVNSVGMPLLNERRGAGDRGGFARLFRDNLRVTLLSVLAGLALVAVAGPLLLSVFGGAFRSSYPVLLVLLAAALPESVTIAVNQLVQARAKLWHALLMVNTPRDLVMPLLAFRLVPVWGALGAAAAYLAGRCIAAGAILLLARSLTIAPADPSPEVTPA